MLPAKLCQSSRQLILPPQLILKARDRRDFFRHRPAAFEPRAYRLIIKLRLISNSGAIDLARAQAAVLSHFKLDDDGQPLRMAKQRGQISGELLRQHWKRLNACVNRSGVLRREMVNGRVLWRKRIDISNADQQTRAAVCERLDEFNLIEVARFDVVNR